jgi:hypothetical protein
MTRHRFELERRGQIVAAANSPDAIKAALRLLWSTAPILWMWRYVDNHPSSRCPCCGTLFMPKSSRIIPVQPGREL